MNITSILITLVGIIIILALYVLGRISRSKLPKTYTSLLPDIKDNDGDKFTSILDDIPAKDGSTPNLQTKDKQTKSVEKQIEQKRAITKPGQIVLFISTNDESGLDGNKIKRSLIKNGLSLGDKDIYHYLSSQNSANSQKQQSLFRIANGIEPWTLTNTDLINQTLTGLSVVMFVSEQKSNKNKVKLLLKTIESIAIETNGIIKNEQQQLLTENEKEQLITKFN